MLKIAGISLASFALYLLFAGQLGAHEAWTGAAIASLTPLWARRVQARASRHFAVSRVHVAPWLRGLARLPPATLRTGIALLRALGSGTDLGHAQRWVFQRGREDDPVERGRRASAVMLASLAPESFVLRTDPGDGGVLIHALGEAVPQPDPLWLA